TDGDSVYAAMHARQLIALCEEIAFEPEVWQKLHGFITGEESRRAWTARLRTGTGRALTARFAPLPDGSTLAVFSDITDSERIAEALFDRDAVLELSEAARGAVDGLVAVAFGAASTSREELAAVPDPGLRDGAAAGEPATDLAGALRQAAAITARPLPPLADGAQGDLAATLDLVAA